jgi:hypothetical protein
MRRAAGYAVVSAALLVSACTGAKDDGRTASPSTSSPPNAVASTARPPEQSATTDLMPRATSPFGWSGGATQPDDLANRAFVATHREAVYGNFDVAGAIIMFGTQTVSAHYSCYAIPEAAYELNDGSLLTVDRAALILDDAGCLPAADYPGTDQIRFVPELLAARPVVTVEREHQDGLRRVRIQSGSTFLDLVEVPAAAPQNWARSLLERSGWTLVGAGVPLGIVASEADMIWYAEYDGPRIDRPDGSYTIPHVVVSGYRVGVRAVADQLSQFGYELDGDGESGVLVARASTGAAGLALLPLGEGAISMLSYDLSSEQLAELIPSLVTAPVAAWLAATASEYES